MILLVLIMTTVSSSRAKCSNEVPPQVPKYHLIEKCHRSTLSFITKANFTSLVSCQRLGIEKKGLALNFSPPEAVKCMEEEGKQIEYTCEVLKCAEADGGLSLVNDTRYDYYSIYAKHLPDVNASCVPGIGMISLISKRLNYSSAEAECRNMSGVLADVVSSETRTDALALLLAGAKVDVAFVGVSSVNGSEFVSVNGDTFECTTYRAWAPGHPKRRRWDYGCVGVSRAKTWHTLRCDTKLPSLCELQPSGPYGRRGKIFRSRIQNGTEAPENQQAT